MTRHRMLRRIAYVRRNRCSALVVALTLFILLNPVLAISAIGGSMLGVALFVVLVLAVWALRLGLYCGGSACSGSSPSTR